MALKIATGGRVGQSEGIVDFWILEKRRIIADDEATARKRLTLRPEEEIISVGDRPFAFTMVKLPTLEEAYRQINGCVVLSSPPVKPEEIRRIPRREDPPPTTWLKRLRNRLSHLVNSEPKNDGGYRPGMKEIPPGDVVWHHEPEPKLISYEVNSNGDTAFPQYSVPEGVKSITFHAPQFLSGPIEDEPEYEVRGPRKWR